MTKKKPKDPVPKDFWSSSNIGFWFEKNPDNGTLEVKSVNICTSSPGDLLALSAWLYNAATYLEDRKKGK